MTAAPPPPPPPPPSTPPPPPTPVPTAAVPAQPSAAEVAASVLARSSETFNVAMQKLDERSAGLGLGVRGSVASVWPALAVVLMTVGLVIDRFADTPTVPVRWMIPMLVLGVVVVVSELRRGGKLPALDALPAWATTRGWRIVFLLGLAVQLTGYFNFGVTQFLWWGATALAAVPVLRGHTPVRAFRVAGHDIAPQLVGAVLVVVALVVGLFPDQADVGTWWSVVGGLCAAAIAGTTLQPVPYASAIRAVGAAVVFGIAFCAATLTIVGLLWVAAAWLVVTSEWRAWTAGTTRPAVRSFAALAVAGGVLAIAGMFGNFSSASGAFGGCMGGLHYGYDYNGDYTSEYNYCEYFLPSSFVPGYSGRGQDLAPLAVAALGALTLLAWRGGAARQVFRLAALAGGVGVFVWLWVVGSAGQIAFWITFGGTVALIAWLGYGLWRERASLLPSTRLATAPE